MESTENVLNIKVSTRALWIRVHLSEEYTAASDSFDAAVFAVHG